MHEPSSTSELAAALERDGAWLLRIARALTRDAEAASDAVQTTLLRAWERARRGDGPGEASRPSRSWLVRVARNALHEDARRAGLRRSAEAQVAREESDSPGPAPLERLELQRRVLDALDGLEEPYRGTLVLRYLDGLAPRAIAARTHVPVKTVHTRIERGLSRLRARLDARHGNDRTAWTSALLALPGVWKGAIVMGAGAKLVAGMAAVAVVAGIWWMRAGAERGRDVEEVRALAASAPLSEPPPADGPEPVRRAEVAPPPAVHVATMDAPSVAPEMLVLHGRVLDVAGGPLSGVTVQGRGAGAPVARTTSGSDGGFTVSWPASALPARLGLDDARFAALREARATAITARREQVIVAAPAGDAAGRVVDDAGLPVADALVVLQYDGRLLVDFPLVLDTAVRVSPQAESDADGRFALAHVPVAAGCRLSAHKRGYAPGQPVALDAAGRELVLVLHALTGSETPPEAEGLVLLPDGSAARGATVRYGMHATRTDASGRFHVPLDDSPDPDLQLAAGLAGHGTAIVEHYGELQAQARPDAPAPVVLVLHREVPSLSGRVEDARGAPLAGWKVLLVDGTALTRRQMPPVLAEGLEGPVACETGADGGFELGNLLERDYELRAYDPHTMLEVRDGPFAAGDHDVRLVVPDGLTYPRVSGHLRSRHGTPVAGARVAAARTLMKLDWGSSWDSGDEVETDASGAFELAGVPRDVHLHVRGEDVMPRDFELAGDVESLELEIPLRCHFRVEVHGGDLEGLGIEVVDATGKALDITTFTAEGSFSQRFLLLAGGRMEIASVSEDAFEVVLSRDLGRGDGSRSELARHALDLAPDAVGEATFTLE